MGNGRLLDQVRDKIRLKHYSTRIEEAYISWIKDFYNLFAPSPNDGK